MSVPASAVKLPVAGFYRRRERRSDPSAQPTMTGTAVLAALAVGSRRSRISPRTPSRSEACRSATERSEALSA